MPISNHQLLATSLWSCGALAGADAGAGADEAHRVEADEAATFVLESSIELGAQIASENNLFWNLADIAAPEAGFDPDRNWWEYYVKPALAISQPMAADHRVYARLSAVGSATSGFDAFDAGDSGQLSIEEAVGGIHVGTPGNGTEWDVSLGAQTYRVGTGMLIANGASNGFRRGALKLGPREAFEMTAIGKVDAGAWATQAFYLDPNENPASDSGTRLAGATVSYTPDADRYAGLAYANVIRSTAPYPQAAPGGIGVPAIIEDARDGLSFVYGFGHWTVLSQGVGDVWLGLDLAREWNDRIGLRAWGGRFEVGLVLRTRWQPKLTLGYQSFSGDDPDTTRLERFDPLYYEGSPDAWATGSKSSMVFINTNVNATQATLELHPTPRDIVSLHIAHVRANELKSPLQFGQATRLEFAEGEPSLIAGVTAYHLADDLFLKYTRVVNPHVFVTVGFSASFPGEGIKRVLGGDALVWTGWLANVVLAY